MKNFVMIVLMVALPSTLFAADLLDQPHWSLEFKGGTMLPEIENWGSYYGSRDIAAYGGSLAFKLVRQVELGVEGMYQRAKGQGNAPLHAESANQSTYLVGEVKYETAPLNAFVLLRGAFSEAQWLVPYAGGGWTRMFYREEVKDQGVARGYADGYHARAGLQLVLDGMDSYAAHRMRSDYGVNHTSFFLEAEVIRAIADTADGGTVDIGGKSWRAGLLFEF